ncbi:translocation elongation factor [Histoplasma capsulatum var. duboisii H88]|uniref:Ribosome assembly protein 1 n=2 Tax=Ajellomyces capsulatus (strain H88) TaxID=544711 RepID=A0A8A1LT93_AJEC8|nr:translocation elongation factor [Histoplasma capsulatum var. duboisii H88]
MPVVNLGDLVRLQQKAEDIRNICILAHVDHGKTSLTDSLIATNGIISPKMAGKIRYLDSRPDEQLRGITMESSAISLYFSMLRRASKDADPEQKEYLINLIDSPGHIDFSSEVSTASRLCDGALVLVDAVEGVCSQTVTVLRHTWVEHLKPILVINKLDRLVTELKMTPAEAYLHLSRVLEQVNAVIGSFYQGERMEEDLQWREKMEERVNAAATKENGRTKQLPDNMDEAISQAESTESQFEEPDDEDLYFSPEKNNVIFCSATDGWAFTIRQFAGLYEKKLGFKRSLLEKFLWGNFYLDPKTKRVIGQKHLKGRNLKPLFVQLVLETIWAVYNATTGGGQGKGDSALLEKITKSLGIAIPAHVLRSRDPRNILITVFSSWLPLSTAVLVSVIEYLPSPPVAQAARLPDMIEDSPGSEAISPHVRDAMVNFKAGKNDPVVAYVSKMVSIPESELPQNTRRSGGMLSPEEAREMARKKREEIAKLEAQNSGEKGADSFAQITSALQDASVEDSVKEKEDPEHLIGFARLYSGTLSVGDSIYVIPPKFSPSHPHASPVPQKVEVKALYLFMGRNLENLQSVPAGVVFGIAGMEGHVLKTGTLCSQLEGAVNLAGVTLSSPPIVRVALEPVNPSDLNKMINGLKLLEKSDPCAVYEVLPNGEHVILTAGELHLERCLKDLRERFAKCEIQAGEAIVPYRETTINAPEMSPPKNPDLPRGTVLSVSASKQLTIQLRIFPLPAEVIEFLTKHAATIKRFYSERRTVTNTTLEQNDVHNDIDDQGDINNGDTAARRILSLEEFKKELQNAFDESKVDKDMWKDVVNRIVEFGPRRIGPNILVDSTSTSSCDKLLLDTTTRSPQTQEARQTTSQASADHQRRSMGLFSDKISYAFQLATAQGPLCSEPIQGIAVLIEDVSVTKTGEEELGRFTGEVIKSARDAVWQGFLDWSPRLLLAMYSCEIQASTEVLGRVYGVITRRRGRILSETMKEGTPFFTILSLLPVAESFGFSDEIRKRTSGAASPQLIFAGFEMLDEDPFWVPATEEELEDLGELADRENVAKRYMDRVRSRKGLLVKGKKLVKDAEKQKTLKR